MMFVKQGVNFGRRFTAHITCVALWLGATAPAFAADADKILEEADSVRAPNRPFKFKVKLVDLDDEKEKDQKTLQASIKGDGETLVNYKTLIKFLEPKADQGKAMLFTANQLWMYFPATRKPIRISQQQRLLGQTSNGDVVNVNFRQDYTAKLAGEDKIDGVACYVLELAAKRPDVTYHRLKYWVAKKNYHPVKTEHYAVSGRLLKTAYYTAYREFLGRSRPAEIVIHDAVNNKLKTRMIYSGHHFESLPDKNFQKDYLQYAR